MQVVQAQRIEFHSGDVQWGSNLLVLGEKMGVTPPSSTRHSNARSRSAKWILVGWMSLRRRESVWLMAINPMGSKSR